MSVGNLTGRERNKVLEIKQSIPLLFECKHTIATKNGDTFFHGVRFFPYQNSGEVWDHVELVQHVKDAYAGRESILEGIGRQDEDDLFENKLDDVEMSGGDDLMDGGDDYASVVRDNLMVNVSVATSVILDGSSVAANGNGTALAVTPQKSSIPHAKYPDVLTDSQIKTLRSNRSVCSGITAAGRMVSHIPSTTPPKQSAASYDGRLTRSNVKRSAKYQE